MDKNHRALKRFGQNYLIDRNIVNKIVSEFSPQKEDQIIEIGPGLGVLTEKLANENSNLTAIEIDKRVIEDLQSKFRSVNFINKDFLKIDLRSIRQDESKKMRVIGNIPYNITSPIFFKLIENREIVDDALFMIQYEVAKRLVAEKRTKEYGILSIILNHFAKVEFCFKVPPTVFRPRPKVYSAVVHIIFNDIKYDYPDKLFINVVKAAFGNRRKSLKNSLSNSIFGVYDLSEIDLDLTKRAEELEIGDFIKLTKYFYDRRE